MYRVCVIGGTGPQGRGLAVRFAATGHRVIIGSRDKERASAVANCIGGLLPPDSRGRLTGSSNADAADAASVVVVATPWDDSATSLRWLAPHVKGKVVITCVNPLGFDRSGPYGLAVEAGSAAEHIARQLPEALMAGAFHHVAASRLADLSVDLSGEDIMVAADDEHALRVAADLCRSISGNSGIDAGPLRACRHLEPLTAVLISVNKLYGTHAGIALRNVDRSRGRRLPAAVG